MNGETKVSLEKQGNSEQQFQQICDMSRKLLHLCRQEYANYQTAFARAENLRSGLLKISETMTQMQKNQKQLHNAMENIMQISALQEKQLETMTAQIQQLLWMDENGTDDGENDIANFFGIPSQAEDFSGGENNGG